MASSLDNANPIVYEAAVLPPRASRRHGHGHGHSHVEEEQDDGVREPIDALEIFGMRFSCA